MYSLVGIPFYYEGAISGDTFCYSKSAIKDKRSPWIIGTISGTVRAISCMCIILYTCVCAMCVWKKEERLCLYCVYDMIFNVCSHHTLYNMQCETAMPGQPE